MRERVKNRLSVVRSRLSAIRLGVVSFPSRFVHGLASRTPFPPGFFVVLFLSIGISTAVTALSVTVLHLHHTDTRPAVRSVESRSVTFEASDAVSGER